jgi:predicted dehydrogenase
MGQRHAETIQRHPAAQLAASCDLRLETAEDVRARYGGADAYACASPESLFADPALDGILICTYHDSHRPLALAALRAGKHVFVEKPLALTVADCREIATEAERCERHLVVGFFARFAPAVREVKAADLHPVASLCQMTDRRWAETFWAQQPGIGGGNVTSQGCHLLDLCCYLHGEEPVAAAGIGGTLTHARGPLDTLAGAIRFASGAVASILVTDAGLSGLAGKVMVQLFAGERTVTLHHLFGGEYGRTAWWPSETGGGVAAPSAGAHDPTGHRRVVECFLEGITTRTLPPGTPTARDGVRAAAVLAALTATGNGREYAVESVQ